MEAFCHRGSARLTYNTDTDSYTMRNLNTGDSMKYFAIICIVLSSLIGVVAASAHSGGTDANGCHTDHKHGGRHCH
jgi:hypothetical protein